MAKDQIEIKVGDVLEGKGGLKVRVRVDAIDGDVADCTLVRSGNKKPLKLATLRSAYRIVESAPRP